MLARDTTRWYGGFIAVVSGVYTIVLSAWGQSMHAGEWVMLVLGAVVLAHGVALLGGLSERLDAISGVIMIGYAVLLVFLQGWLGVLVTSRSSSASMTRSVAGTEMGWATMPWDPGMTAIAIIVLGSGVIMTARTRRWM